MFSCKYYCAVCLWLVTPHKSQAVNAALTAIDVPLILELKAGMGDFLSPF